MFCINDYCDCKFGNFWSVKKGKCGKKIFNKKIKNFKLIFCSKVEKLGYNQKCTDEDKCDDSRGLNCINGSCICEENNFFNNSLCGILKKNFF